MKSQPLILFVCFLFSINCFSQKITYKDLIGTWEYNNAGYYDPTLKLMFADSIHLIMGGSTLNYTIDTSFSTTLLHATGISQFNLDVNTYCFVKILGNDTLITQFVYDIEKDIKWNDSLSAKVITGIYLRRKEH